MLVNDITIVNFIRNKHSITKYTEKGARQYLIKLKQKKFIQL